MRDTLAKRRTRRRFARVLESPDEGLFWKAPMKAVPGMPR
jgi:hypothetical protein